MARLFALVDCNNFYPSCERVFQPALRGWPVVVLSNNDGCVIARSNEAKALGIETGAPWHLYKGRFTEQGVTVRSSNCTLCGDMSARVMRILADFTPDLEIYSIDEAFLDLAGVDDGAAAWPTISAGCARRCSSGQAFRYQSVWRRPRCWPRSRIGWRRRVPPAAACVP